MLSQEEYEYIQRTIHECKYSPNDFEISTTDMIERSQKLHMDITEVSVQFIPTKVTRTYISGFGLSWIQAFEKDIKNGAYDILK
jgi:hypothetical protein